jgi:hypothetical protein
MREFPAGRVKAVPPYAELWQPLTEEPSFVLRAMFGSKAVYLDGLLMLCFSAAEEPWRGILVCTDRPHHASLRAEFSILVPHPVLGKWLYLSESEDAFERVADRLVQAVRGGDPRIGVVPKARKRTPRSR